MSRSTALPSLTIHQGALSTRLASLARALVEDATRVDGVAPFSEQPMLWLADDEAPIVHVLALDGDRLAGLAQVDLGVHGHSTAELVVAPRYRRKGLGAELLAAARGIAPERRFAVWAHGDLPAARALAETAGLTVTRELWLMRLDLAARPPLPPTPLADGVTVREFVVGQDEQAWVTVNARAFADHPEQGRMTVADVVAREREPWFDPAGFLLAEQDGVLLASMWTKVVDGIGEIYVLGVDPSAQGLGLGSALTRLALEQLESRGLAAAILYTSADNERAVRTYARAGFAPSNVDVTFG